MSSRRLRILLVEDDAVHAKIIRRTLEARGHAGEFRHVASGEAALDLLNAPPAPVEAADERAYRPDLVLLDIRMPTLDGFDVLRAIRTTDAVRCTPVVMVSTSDDPRDVRRAYELGANAYISKPADFEGLSQKLDALDRFWSSAAELPS